MKGLFSGLEELGFNETNLVEHKDLFAKKEQATTAQAEKVVKPEDFIYKRQVECKVCDKMFTDVVMKQRAAKLIKTDTDLRPYFEPLDPIFYDVIMCEHCGYTAISSMFPRITERQMDKITQQVTPRFKRKEYPLVLSADDAVERYKLALLNSVVKEGKSGEKAYICLKLAWVYRIIPDAENELAFLRNAFAGFEKAYTDERFPICGLDEHTLSYMLADIARRLGEFDVALRYLSRLLVNPNVPPRIKDRATTIKELVRNRQIIPRR